MSDEQYEIDETLGRDVTRKFFRLIEAREKRDTDKAAAELSETEYRDIEAEVWEAMEDSPLKPPYKVDLGEYGVVRFHPKQTVYGKIVDDEAALEYFEERAMVDEVTKPKFAMKQINEMVRELYEQGESMPPGVTFSPKRYVQITRQKDGA